jgi:hypothetical protein
LYWTRRLSSFGLWASVEDKDVGAAKSIDACPSGLKLVTVEDGRSKALGSKFEKEESDMEVSDEGADGTKDEMILVLNLNDCIPQQSQPRRYWLNTRVVKVLCLGIGNHTAYAPSSTGSPLGISYRLSLPLTCCILVCSLGLGNEITSVRRLMRVV